MFRELDFFSPGLVKLFHFTFQPNGLFQIEMATHHKVAKSV